MTTRAEQVQQAALRYRRAAQVAADVSDTMRKRLDIHGWTNEQAAAVLVAALPSIVGAILEDPDIMYPEEEE